MNYQVSSVKKLSGVKCEGTIRRQVSMNYQVSSVNELSGVRYQ